MWQIYKRASEVVLVVGRHADENEFLFKVHTSLADLFESTRHRGLGF